MTSETDQQFMDRVDLDLDLNNTADIQRLFALARRGAAVQWRPIEEAPKGPENIFGIEPWGSRWIGAQLWWDDMVEEWTDVHSDRYRKPTHWMPLPPPPAGETNE